jgi:O-antigen/teichoic acid export membrane protein
VTTPSVEPAGSLALSQAKSGALRGTLVNLAGTAITMALGFFTTPYFIHRLGPSAYGVYSLVLVFTMSGYFGYLDFGIQSATVNRASGSAARGRWDEFSDTIAASLIGLAALGLASGALIIGFAPFAVDVFNVPASLQNDLTLSLRIVGICLIVQFPSLALVAALQTLHRWDLVVIQRTITSVLGVGAAALLVARQHDLLRLVLPVVLAPTIGSLLLLLLCRTVVPRFRPRVLRTSRNTVVHLLRTGRTFFLAQSGIAIVGNLDQILIAAFLTSQRLAQYAVAATLYYAVFALLPITNATAFAAASHFNAVGDDGRIRALVLRGTRYGASVVLAATASGALFGPAFIRAWVGEGFGASGTLLLIWLTHMCVTAFTGVPHNVLSGVGRVRQAAWISGASVVINAIVSLALVRPYGMNGVVLGTVVSYGITSPIWIHAALRASDVAWRDFLRVTVAPAYGAAACAAVAGGAILGLAHPASLSGTFGAGAVTFVVGLLATIGLLTRAERSDLISGTRIPWSRPGR